MLKTGIITLILTIIAISLKNQMIIMLRGLHNLLFLWIDKVAKVLPLGGHSRATASVVVLVLAPIILDIIISYIYWAIKREACPYTKHIAILSWVVMLIVFML